MEDDVCYVTTPELLLKKQILGLQTYVDKDDNIVEIVEVFGQVKAIQDNKVIIEGDVWSQKESDEEMEIKQVSDYSFPFDSENYWHADEGEYKTILSGQTVSNVDVLTQWRVTA